jgi:hypothetical protein
MTLSDEQIDAIMIACNEGIWIGQTRRDRIMAARIFARAILAAAQKKHHG